MAATMGRGFLQLESEWSLSGTGTMVFQDTVNILGCGLQGKKGRKPKRMAGQAVGLCYVHLASAMPLPLSDGCQHSECLISYSWLNTQKGQCLGQARESRAVLVPSVSSQCFITDGPLLCTSVLHQALMLLLWVIMSILLLGSSENKLWVPRRPLTRV